MAYGQNKIQWPDWSEHDCRMRQSGVLEIAKSDSRKKGIALEDKFSEPLCQQLRLKYFNTLVVICAPHAT